MSLAQPTAVGDLGVLLKASFQVGASDIHLKPNTDPMFRVDGELRPVEHPPFDDAKLESFCVQVSGRTPDQLQGAKQFEFSVDLPQVGRFRGHFFRYQGKPALALRPIPLEIPTLKDLRLPAITKRICQLSRGLVLVTGPTGVGKTTTIAAMLDNIARTSCRHVVTIEDPVEFIIDDGHSCINQREVGRDVEGYGEGLRAALRQDPDVVMLGEIRDRSTMEVALHAALSGHLVISTAHFADATATVNGIIGLAPRAEQINWRARLADALQAVISQRLLNRADRPGRVLATELMIREPTARACILDETKTSSLRSVLERGRAEGLSHTLDQCLLELIEAKLISLETARAAATSPANLMREANLRRIGK
jgi:twitching motility protein PilT